MIQPVEARKLCSKSEWKLIESSFQPAVQTLPQSELKSRIDQARKIFGKVTDNAGFLRTDSRKRIASQKAEMLAEAIGRFEAALKVGANSPQSAAVMNLDAFREQAGRKLESRKSHARSSRDVRGEQQSQKSGAARVQSHIKSVTRRNQARRDTKNR